MHTAKIFVLALFAAATSLATTIHVPADHATIQAAIDASADGDTVLVEPGTYYENINFHGKKIVLASRYLLTLDPAYIAQTVINGSLPANPDTASVVLFISGEDANSVLEGFTITGGTGTAWKDEHSAGVYREGGGILTAFTSPTIRNNLIIRNHATNKTGLTSGGGGGIRSGDGNPKILNNVIMENDGHYGGGVVLNYTAFTLENNVIYKNDGGADFGGGGVWINGNGAGLKTFVNNTVVGNSATLDAGGVYISSVSFTMRNSIIWGNTAPSEPQIGVGGATLRADYCDIQGGWTPGVGTVNVDPQFVDTSYYLSPTSPCVDAGDPGAGYADPEDSPGLARYPARGTVRNDIGAYGGPRSARAVYVDLHLNDPRPPSGLTAYSDYLAPGSALLQWTDPTMLNGGAPLSQFKLHLYRDSVYIAEVDSGIQAYTAAGLTLHQRYTFSARAVIANDSSTLVSATVYAGGHAQPQPPTSFDLSDASAGVRLSWRNPSRQIDNTPLNDLLAVLVYRDSVLVDSLPQSIVDTAQARSILDTVQGFHSYFIRVVDSETPRHSSTATAAILGHGGLVSGFSEGFESGAASVYRTGTWDTTSAFHHGGSRSLTDSRVGNYENSTTTVVMTPPVVLGAKSFLEVSHIAIIAFADIGYVEISRNTRKTYTVLKPFNLTMRTEWQDAHADSTDWVTQFFDLSAYAGDTVTVRFRLLTNGTNTADGWYLDDITLGNVPPPGTFLRQMDSSWNFLSVPVVPASRSFTSLFPGGSPSGFTYAGSHYAVIDTAAAGAGFWLKCPLATPVTFAGSTIIVDTIDLLQGWNTVGAISIPLAMSALRTIPSNIVSSQFYGYDGAYYAASTLDPGKAYWIRSRQPGKLIYSSFLSGAQPASNPKEGVGVADCSAIEFTDRSGRRQTLYLGEGDRQVLEELPPLPPQGSFDIRFRSSRLVESVVENGREIPIALQGVHYPLTVRWSRSSRGTTDWWLLDGQERRSLGRSGTFSIASEGRLSIRGVRTGASALPEAFELDQNFPNPFNPVTTVRYGLPVDARVTMRVYNIMGQEVRTLLAGKEIAAGFGTIEFDGSALPSGLYIYRLEAVAPQGVHFTSAGKMLLVK